MIRKSSLVFIAFLAAACSGSRPEHLGGPAESLTPCPESPNCVSSLSTSEQHSINAFQFEGDAKTALTKLQGIITAAPKAQIIFLGDHYLYAEFTSDLMGYVDDVEFLITPAHAAEGSFEQDKTLEIHVKSASRLGKSDFGANRERIESIRAQFNKTQ